MQKKCYKFNHNIPSWSRWVESLRNLQFHQCFRSRFYTRRSQICKKESKVISAFLHFWDLHVQKLLVKRWWNWHLMKWIKSQSQFHLLSRSKRVFKLILRFNSSTNSGETVSNELWDKSRTSKYGKVIDSSKSRLLIWLLLLVVS